MTQPDATYTQSNENPGLTISAKPASEASGNSETQTIDLRRDRRNCQIFKPPVFSLVI
jgi:hypothetical protein